MACLSLRSLPLLFRPSLPYLFAPDKLPFGFGPSCPSDRDKLLPRFGPFCLSALHRHPFGSGLSCPSALHKRPFGSGPSCLDRHPLTSSWGPLQRPSDVQPRARGAPFAAAFSSVVCFVRAPRCTRQSRAQDCKV